MSVVIALKDKDGKCWMACDEQITTGSRKAYLGDSHFKIFDVQDRPGIMMGHVGYLRGINLLETNNSYFDELSYYRKEIGYDYMVNKFVPMVDNLFRTSGFSDDDSNLTDLHGESLVVADGYIYEIGQDGSVLMVDEYSAIGSGAELALGSLDTSEGADVKDRLVMAVKAATKNIYCSGNIIIMNDTDEDVYQFEF